MHNLHPKHNICLNHQIKNFLCQGPRIEAWDLVQSRQKRNEGVFFDVSVLVKHVSWLVAFGRQTWSCAFGFSQYYKHGPVLLFILGLMSKRYQLHFYLCGSNIHSYMSLILLLGLFRRFSLLLLKIFNYIPLILLPLYRL